MSALVSSSKPDDGSTFTAPAPDALPVHSSSHLPFSSSTASSTSQTESAAAAGDTIINIKDSTSGAPVKPKSEADDLENDPEYLKYLRALYAKWTDCPTVTINYYNLSYGISVEKKTKDIVTIPRALLNVALAVPRLLASYVQSEQMKRAQFTHFSALNKVAGCIAPGSLTLVLAPPGHGKTTLLKAISGRLQGQPGFTGSLMYNGMTAAECRARGINVSRLCAYVGQQDFTFPTLTVKETLEFAATNSTPVIEQLTKDAANAELIDFDHRRAELLINMLGMKECKDTIVGNDMLRGISGGQKRRVALAEMLLTNARVYCLDEVSTGLDAAVTKYIFTQLREAAKITKASFVTALLQPTPETYELFDNVILLREGVVVYHGPRAEVDEWLRVCCGFRRPEGIDEAQFIVDVLSDPVQAHHTQIEMEKLHAMHDAASRTTKLIKKTKVSEEKEQREEFMETKQAHEQQTESAQALQNEVPELVIRMPSVNQDNDKNLYDEQLYPAASPVTFHVSEHEVFEEKQTPKALFGQGEMEFNQGKKDQQVLPMVTFTRSRSGSQSEGRLPSQFNFNAKSADWYVNNVGAAAGDAIVTAPAIDTDTMHFNYKHSQWYARSLLYSARQMNDSDELDSVNWSKYTKVMFGSKYPHSLWRHTYYCLIRQFRVISRNQTMVRPRLAQSIIMGFILGTLFYQLDAGDYADKMGLLLYCIMYCAFTNLTEIPVASEAKSVVGKQLDAGFFPPLAYTISVIIVHIPLTVVEILLFSPLIYFVPGFTYDAGRFFFFLLILFSTSTALSVLFRAISYSAKNPDIARQLDLPVIIIFLIFGGFLLPYDSVPHWLIWVYYISPFSWAVRSLALNEFKAGRFDDLNGNGERAGDVYLDAFGIFTDDIWKWMGFVYLVGFFLFGAMCCVFILGHIHPVTALGTRRRAVTLRRLQAPKRNFLFGDDGHLIVNEVDGTFKSTNVKKLQQPQQLPAIKRQKTQKTSSIPFESATIAWKDLNYTVFVGKNHKAKQLLHSVNGFALPGEMTALMGASGAGKTTLMDVIAARKTTGKIEGEILVNGQKVSNEDFQHLMGYVEQNDIHMGTQTVKEALFFSAKMRLPKSVTDDQRNTFVAEVMELVGLTKIAHRMIGDEALPGLSTGQLKLVTIAVELVANPSILFLDEPTSGLDAPAALRVMRAVRNIAATGRTVVCTIHQPSAQLFYMFDRLLLLRSGGRTVYFSKIGKKARRLVEYFESLSSDIPHCPRHINPANWMLDVIGAAGHNSLGFDFADRWDESPLAQDVKKELDVALEKKEAPATAAKIEFLKWTERYWQVQKRLYVSHWRNPPMNATRILLMFSIGLMFGVIYYFIGEGSYSSLQAKLSVSVLGIVFPGSVCAQSSLPSLFRQRPVYYRELTSGMYNAMAWSTALALVEMPFIALALVFFLMPYYFMVGFAMSAPLFWKMALDIYTMAICYSFLAQMWLALLPNIVISNVINGIVASLWFIFSGIFIHPTNINNGWKWFYYMNPVQKAFVATVTTQFDCSDANPSCPTVLVPSVGEQSISDYVNEILSSNADYYWQWWGWLILTIAIIRIFTLIFLHTISHIKR